MKKIISKLKKEAFYISECILLVPVKTLKSVTVCNLKCTLP